MSSGGKGQRAKVLFFALCPFTVLFDRFQDFDLDLGHACLDHVEPAGSAQGEVEDAASDEGAAVVDFDIDAAAVAQVGDPDEGSKGEFPVGGGEAVHVVDFTAGGGPSVKVVGIVGGEADLVGATGGDRRLLLFGFRFLGRRF